MSGDGDYSTRKDCLKDRRKVNLQGEDTNRPIIENGAHNFRPISGQILVTCAVAWV